MKKFLLIILATILLFSCGQNNPNETSLVSHSEEAELVSTVSDQNESVDNKLENNFEESANKKIIKDGRIGIEVEDIHKTKKKVDTLIKNIGGYYANEKLNNVNNYSSYNLDIRIPNTKFETFITSIESSYGKLLYKEITSRDVTEQFIDIEIRLANKKNYLERYRELLKRANSIKEILEIEEKIRNIEEEIESATGQLKYLNDRVNYSTLRMEITKPVIYNTHQRDNFTQRIKHAIVKGWYGFVTLMVFFVNIWPLWIFLIIGYFIWRRYKRKN